MDTQLIFKIFNFGVLIPWAMMLILPKWKGTQWMVQTRFPVLIIACAYLFLVVWDAVVVQGGGIDFTSFESIKQAFSRDEVLLVGWLHYLAFDLFVGMWEFDDAQKLKLPHYVLAPCMVMTLMLGPIGFVLYWVFRQCFRKKVDILT